MYFANTWVAGLLLLILLLCQTRAMTFWVCCMKCLPGRGVGQQTASKKGEPPASCSPLRKSLYTWVPSACDPLSPLHVDREGLPWSLNLGSPYTAKSPWSR